MQVLKDFFAKNKRKYATVNVQPQAADVPEGIMTKCPNCKKIMFTRELNQNLKVCLDCGYHFQMGAMERIHATVDPGTFVEWDGDLQSTNPIGFPGYEEKLRRDREKAKLNEAVVTGAGEIEGYPTAIAVMDPFFRMGSMGTVVGEKITRAIERADEAGLPIVIFTASGGARMQEGVLSLMQMGKTSAALKRFSDHGGLSITVMTHPTTGGVSASFASLGDYHLSEPGALIGFAGRRIIEQTIREKLPDDFQTAEFLLKHGQLDAVIHRKQMKETLGFLLGIHQKEGDRE